MSNSYAKRSITSSRLTMHKRLPLNGARMKSSYSLFACRRSIQNQPVGVELKPATFFPLNRSEMFWQGVTRRFLGKSSGNELDFDGFEVDCGVVAGSFAFDA